MVHQTMNSWENARWKDGSKRSERWKETLRKGFLPRVSHPPQTPRRLRVQESNIVKARSLRSAQRITLGMKIAVYRAAGARLDERVKKS